MYVLKERFLEKRQKRVRHFEKFFRIYVLRVVVMKNFKNTCNILKIFYVYTL